MPAPDLEDRVAELESQLDQLRDEVRSSKSNKDWRRTIGAFTDDEGVKEVLAEAMRLREADRRKAHEEGNRKTQQ